ncbi:lysoplasmalogenase [Streptomyces sp. NPDC002787]
MRPDRGLVLLVVFGLAVAVDLGSLALGFTPGHVLAKPLLMPSLAAYAYTRGGPRPLVAALLFGWVGDVLLLSDTEPAFLTGMGCFAAGHVCYLVVFSRLQQTGRQPGTRAARARAARIPVACGVAYGSALVVAVAGLWPGLPADLRLPVACYSALLTAMAWAAARLGLVAGVGGALFLVSDMLIATGVAEWPQPPRPDLWIMLTYLAAQYLLVQGVLRNPGARSPATPAYGEVPTSTA